MKSWFLSACFFLLTVPFAGRPESLHHSSTAIDTVIVTVNPGQVINQQADRLLGISFDSRTSMMTGSQANVPAGYYDPSTGMPYPGVDSLWSRVPITGVRYPGNAANQGVNWSYTIGPVATRPLQQLSAGTPMQRVVFGFDEFMDMVAARGLPSSEVQIMVWIYPTATASDPAGLAADWVEYANAPNDSSNPRGGVDWAAVRASNGHHEPYNISVWNIGNEPWASGEFNFDPTNYIPLASQIIDAMLQADSTIQVTLPAVGNGNSPWNQALLTSPLLAGKFWGLSPHFFYDEDPSTPNPTVSQQKTALISLAQAAAARGKKVIIGDHAYGIQTPPIEPPDRAMQWRGALITTDFLLMASQIANIELANFWIYGMPAAVYHPIRRNGDGTYTMLSVAALYQVLRPVFLDRAYETTAGLTIGGFPQKIRAAAFGSNDGLQASVVVVNTDTTTDARVVPPTIAGLTLVRSRLLSATNLFDDMFTTTTVAPLTDGRYSLTRAGVLVFEYLYNYTSVNINVQDKWNMVSVPVQVSDYSTTVLFPTAVSEAFAYSGGYEVRTTLANGLGYWLKFNGVQSVQISGIARTQDTIAVVAGWNMIGGLSQVVQTSSVASLPPGIITSPFFEFGPGGYSTSSSIQPGKAYWIKVNQNGSLILSVSGAAFHRPRTIPHRD